MNIIWLQATSLIYIILLIIVYFSKKRLKTKENQIYEKLLFANFIGLIIEISCMFSATMIETKVPLRHYILTKGLLIYYLGFIFMYSYYVFLVSKNNLAIKKIDSYLNKVKKICLVLFIITSVIVCKLPIKFFDDGISMYSYGKSVDFLRMIFVVSMFVWIVVLVKNYKHVKTKKYTPIILFILLAGVGGYVQSVYPGLLLTTAIETFIVFLMYFTIENPDLKVVNELLRNKELVERQMEDKSRFLFEISQDIKTPTKNILGITKNFDKLENDIDKKDAVRLISSNANDLLFKLNNVLDISSMDASKIKIKEEYYDTAMFFKTIESMTQNAIGNKNIKLKFEVNSNVPEKLNGDDVKLKQILMSVLLNSIENTENGFINVNIGSIVRYDVARLVIKIEDSGVGMSLDKINSILDDNMELTLDETSKLNKLDMDLKATIKVIKLLGGSINIKSKKDEGTTFMIVLDQKCDIEQSSDFMKNVEKYSSDIFGRKRVLLVNDDKEENFKISNILGEYNIDLNVSMTGKDCIDRINNGEFYNLIIIDDELGETSALQTLNELNKNKKFKTPVIVMLKKDKEHFKKYYIDDGFKDIISKENIEEEIKEKIDKYL